MKKQKHVFRFCKFIENYIQKYRIYVSNSHPTQRQYFVEAHLAVFLGKSLRDLSIILFKILLLAKYAGLKIYTCVLILRKALMFIVRYTLEQDSPFSRIRTASIICNAEHTR
jgi:hypothetical protein